MESMQNQLAATADLRVRSLKVAHLIRAATLFALGVFVAFTATSHEELEFDVTTMIFAFALIALVTFIEYWVLRNTAESWWIAARAVIAVAAAGSLFAVTDSASFALVIALWALITAIITAMRLARKVQPAGVAIPSLSLSLLLAASVLVVRDDPVAIIGLFGAYALLRGVFLGIAAFDARHPQDAETPSIPDQHLNK